MWILTKLKNWVHVLPHLWDLNVSTSWKYFQLLNQWTIFRLMSLLTQSILKLTKGRKWVTYHGKLTYLTLSLVVSSFKWGIFVCFINLYTTPHHMVLRLVFLFLLYLPGCVTLLMQLQSIRFTSDLCSKKHLVMAPRGHIDDSKNSNFKNPVFLRTWDVHSKPNL